MIGANISNADVIGHDDYNVRLFGLRRLGPSVKHRREGQCSQTASD